MSKLTSSKQCATFIKNVSHEVRMQTLNIREIRRALSHLETLLDQSGEIIITTNLACFAINPAQVSWSMRVF